MRAAPDIGTDRLGTLGIVVAGLAACAVAAALTASGPGSQDAALQAAARALMVGAPIAVGLYARRQPATARFGSLLVLAGFGWFMATLSESHDAWIYSVGRVSGWLVEVVLIYLILAFPTGRLRAEVDRALVAAAGLVVLVLYLPTALLVETYPVPSPWADCGDGCPGNAFMVVASEPAFVGDVMLPLRDALIVALFVAATAYRLADATPARSPARARAGAGGVALPARRLRVDGHRAPHRPRLAARRGRSVAARAHRAVAGPRVSRRRLELAALHGLRDAARGHAGAGASRAGALRAGLADAFDDPSLDIVYWIDDGGGGGWTPPAATWPPPWRLWTAR